MKTKYDTGDEVLIPVKIKGALKIAGEIMYTIQDFSDITRDANALIPESLIEGKAKIGREKYYREQWDKKE